MPHCFKRLAASHVSSGAASNPGDVSFYTNSMRAELDKRAAEKELGWVD